MTHYDRLKSKRLGDILVDEGMVTREAVIAALHEQQQTGRLLSDVLLEGREVNDYDLARIIVEQYQAPFLDLKSCTLHKDFIEEFPAALLHQARVVPLDRFGRHACFACQEVPSQSVADQLKHHAPDGMYFYIASSYEIRTALHEHVPLAEEETPEVPEAAETVAVDAPGGEWENLFDCANESVLNELDEE